jgi:hypothetical protein
MTDDFIATMFKPFIANDDESIIKIANVILIAITSSQISNDHIIVQMELNRITSNTNRYLLNYMSKRNDNITKVMTLCYHNFNPVFKSINEYSCNGRIKANICICLHFDDFEHCFCGVKLSRQEYNQMTNYTALGNLDKMTSFLIKRGRLGSPLYQYENKLFDCIDRYIDRMIPIITVTTIKSDCTLL